MAYFYSAENCDKELQVDEDLWIQSLNYYNNNNDSKKSNNVKSSKNYL
jgi:hypothetical protein